uniref:Uncharacterized protein n=1 Tax=Sphaerodactylus townsendi TaxID=933632 RepID=A0ACB8E6I4_9SAUR
MSAFEGAASSPMTVMEEAVNMTGRDQMQPKDCKLITPVPGYDGSASSPPIWHQETGCNFSHHNLAAPIL